MCDRGQTSEVPDNGCLATSMLCSIRCRPHHVALGVWYLSARTKNTSVSILLGLGDRFSALRHPLRTHSLFGGGSTLMFNPKTRNPRLTLSRRYQRFGPHRGAVVDEDGVIGKGRRWLGLKGAVVDSPTPVGRVFLEGSRPSQAVIMTSKTRTFTTMYGSGKEMASVR